MHKLERERVCTHSLPTFLPSFDSSIFPSFLSFKVMLLPVLHRVNKFQGLSLSFQGSSLFNIYIYELFTIKSDNHIDVWQVTVWVGKSQKRRCYPWWWCCWGIKKVYTHSLPTFLRSFLLYFLPSFLPSLLPSFLSLFHLSILPFFLAFLLAWLLTFEKPTSAELNKMWVKM